MLTGGAKLMMMGIMTLFAISVLAHLLKQIYNEKKVKFKVILISRGLF